MATLASRTKLLSGLASGTLAQHLAAITAGSGTGKTIFASQFCVAIQTPELSVSQKIRQTAISQVNDRTTQYTGKSKKNLSVATITSQLFIHQIPDEIFLTQKNHAVQATTKLETRSVLMKHR